MDTTWLDAALGGLLMLAVVAAVIVLGVHYLVTRDRLAAPPKPPAAPVPPVDPDAGSAIKPTD